jgi:hypothetical protein
MALPWRLSTIIAEAARTECRRAVLSKLGEGVADVGLEQFFEVGGNVDHFLEEEVDVSRVS